MAIAPADVNPLTQASANLSVLADHVKAGAEKIVTKNGKSHVALIDAGHTCDACEALLELRRIEQPRAPRHTAAKSGKFNLAAR